LDDVVRTTDHLPFDSTDCAVPMLWAMQHNVEVDAFVVYTDSESWSGKIHVSEALRMYRQKFNIPAKLVVVGMTATQFTVADPNDAGSLNVVGFDTSSPEILSSFVRGDF
jgi:60 kDa SS-A/Ro ribonucleoprotein